MTDRDGNELRIGDPVDVTSFAPGYCERNGARVGGGDATWIVIHFDDPPSCEVARTRVIKRT